jgi:hypothetical protein
LRHDPLQLLLRHELHLVQPGGHPVLDTFGRTAKRLVDPRDQHLLRRLVPRSADWQINFTANFTFSASSANASATTARVPKRCRTRAFPPGTRRFASFREGYPCPCASYARNMVLSKPESG